MNVKFLFITLLILTKIYAAYPLLTNRNHPELNWQTCQSKNFEIIYSDNLDSIAKESAIIAEAVYDSLSASLNQKFNYRYKILISDMDDIPNGATVPFGFFFIWVNPSQYKSLFTGNNGWLRQVIAHEMVHALLDEKTKTWQSYIWPISPIPRNINEGMAQFYSGEKWGLMRGDYYLNQAAYTGNYNYNSTNLDYGGLMYAEGFSLIRNLKSEFPDTTIVKIFNYRNFTKQFDFEKSFEKNIGIKYMDYITKFQKKINAYYNFRKANTENLIAELPEFKSINASFIKNVRFSPDGKYLAAVAIKSLGDHDQQIILYDLKDSIEQILTSSGLSVTEGLTFSADSKELVFSRLHYGKNGSLITDLFAINIQSKKERMLTSDQRAFSPVCLAQNCYAFLKNDGINTNIYRLNPDGTQQKLTEFKKIIRLEELSVSTDKLILTASFKDENNRTQGLLTYNFSENITKEVLIDSFLVFRPLFLPNDNNQLIYTYSGTDVNNLWKLNLQTGEKVQLTNQADYLMGLSFLNKDTVLAICQNDRNKNQLIKIDINRKPQFYESQINPYYDRWPGVTPDHPPLNENFPICSTKFTGNYNSFANIRHWYSLPFPAYINKNISISLNSVFADPLLKHQLSTYLAIDHEDLEKINYGFTYVNRSLASNITVGAINIDKFLNTLYAGDKLLFNHKNINFSIILPQNSGQFLSANHNFGVGYSYDKIKISNTEDFVNNNQIKSGSISEPINYKSSTMIVDYSYKNGLSFNSGAGYNPVDFVGFHYNYKMDYKKFGSDFDCQTGQIEMFAIYPLFRNQLLAKPVTLLSNKSENFDLLDRVTLNLYHSFSFQKGETAPQKQIGIDRYMHVDVASIVPGIGSSDKRYIRGNEQYLFGNRMYNLSTELYIPLTKELGIGWPKFGISIDHFGVAGFIDGAYIWNNSDFDHNMNIWRDGVEVKGAFSFFSQLLAYGGVSWNMKDKQEKERYYWGIKTFFPF